MGEQLNIIFLLAVCLGFAALFGYTAQFLKLSPIVGYLLAGYLLGPNSPGFVVDIAIAEQLASIGVTLLMFAVGLNFSWKDLIAVKNIALPGAMILAALCISCGMILSIYLGETPIAGFVIGVAICVSSTVVIVRVLAGQDLLHTRQGHIVVGWTIVEDLISVFGLVLLPALATAQSLDTLSSPFSFFYPISLVLVKIGLFGILVYFIGERVLEQLLKCVARTRSHELFTLSILACVFLIAIGSSYFFNVSIALGAFIAGTVVGKTEVSHQAAANALPMRDAFAVIFFLSVGMLFDPGAVAGNLPLFFAVLCIIVLLRPFFAFLIMRIANYPFAIAITVALAIMQIGEYSFILAENGSQLNILPDSAYDILVACSFLTIGLNPILFQLFSSFYGRASDLSIESNELVEDAAREQWQQPDDHHSTFLPQIVVVGFGPVGQIVYRRLSEKGYQPLVIDHNIDHITTLKRHHAKAVFGDAAQFTIMEKADLDNTRILIITISNFTATQSIIQTARHINPFIEMIVRCHSPAGPHKSRLGDISVVYDEEATAEQLLEKAFTNLEST